MKKHHRRSRRHRDERLSRERLFWLGLGIIVVYIFTIVGIEYVGGYIEKKNTTESFGSLEGRFEKQLSIEYEEKSYVHSSRNYENLLLIGVDTEDIESSSVSLRSGGQADFVLLLSFDRSADRIAAIQLDRDTITEIQTYGTFGNPMGGQEMQLCLAYAFGSSPEMGCENTARAVSDLLGGIAVDNYIAMDMNGMAALNDALGGVTVTLEDDLSDRDPAMTKGTTLTLRGEQAEIFLRSRRDVGDGTNRSRMDRQAQFMQAAVEVIRDKTTQDAAYAGKLFEQMKEHLFTNVSSGWLANLAMNTSGYGYEGIMSPTGSHSIGEDGFMEFHLDENALEAFLIENFFVEK